MHTTLFVLHIEFYRNPGFSETHMLLWISYFFRGISISCRKNHLNCPFYLCWEMHPSGSCSRNVQQKKTFCAREGCMRQRVNATLGGRTVQMATMRYLSSIGYFRATWVWVPFGTAVNFLWFYAWATSRHCAHALLEQRGPP